MKETYSSSEVVFVAEFMKVIASMFLIFSDRADSGTAYFHLPPVNFYLLSLTIIGMTTIDAQGSGGAKLLWLILRAHKIIVLVVLYSIANLLAYYALARVDAAVYTVVLQVSLSYSFASKCV